MSRIRFLFFILIAVTIFISATSFKKNISQNKNSYTYINTNIKLMMRLYGIERTADIIDNSFKQNLITIDECHDLLHILGHNAYEFHPNDLLLLTSPKSSLCLDSYQHGVEAQIVLENFTDPEKMYLTLHKYCNILKEKDPGITCYHGVGHASVQETRDVKVALKICDTLGGQTDSPSDCYRGAFSEYANELKGIDGDTNAPIPGVVPVTIPKGHEYDACLSLEKKYQNDCVSQFTSYVYNGDLEKTFAACSKQPQWISEICSRVASADYILTNFPKTKVTPPPQNLEFQTWIIKKGYIDGTLEGLSPYTLEYGKKILPNFCNLLVSEQEKEYCLNRLSV